MLNPQNITADDRKTKRMNATDLSDEAQPHEVTEKF